MGIITKIKLFTASFVILVVSGVPALAFGAVNYHANAQPIPPIETPADTDQPTDLVNHSSNKGAAAQTKLTDAKLKACQKHEKAITNILTRISNRGQKQLDLFTSIATKTETFYTDKGKTLSNYDALVADVAAKKAAAQTVVTAIAADSKTFTCDGSDPKGVAAAFKDELKSEITALKDYKTAVKNLIIGVKSVQGSTTSTDSKATGGN